MKQVSMDSALSVFKKLGNITPLKNNAIQTSLFYSIKMVGITPSFLYTCKLLVCLIRISAPVPLCS